MSSFVYPHARSQFAQAAIDWTSDDFRVIMIDTADYSPASSTTDADLDDIPAAAEVATSTAGMTGLVVEADGRCKANNVTITGVSGDATNDSTEALVVYRHTGATDADRWLICYIDNAQVAHVPNTGDVEIQWNASGIFQL